MIPITNSNTTDIIMIIIRPPAPLRQRAAAAGREAARAPLGHLGGAAAGRAHRRAERRGAAPPAARRGAGRAGAAALRGRVRARRPRVPRLLRQAARGVRRDPPGRKPGRRRGPGPGPGRGLPGRAGLRGRPGGAELRRGGRGPGGAAPAAALLAPVLPVGLGGCRRGGLRRVRLGLPGGGPGPGRPLRPAGAVRVRAPAGSGRRGVPTWRRRDAADDDSAAAGTCGNASRGRARRLRRMLQAGLCRLGRALREPHRGPGSARRLRGIRRRQPRPDRHLRDAARLPVRTLLPGRERQLGVPETTSED